MFERILVATDGSDTATRAVDRAAAIAEVTGAALTVLSAGPPAKTEPVLSNEAARLAGRGLSVDTRASDRDPASAIVEAAEGGEFDLVVVGNKGMTGASRFFTLGSVPNKVSHALPTNLLIVRTT